MKENFQRSLRAASLLGLEVLIFLGGANTALADSSIGTNISTSASGTITSSGLLTGNAGLTITGGASSLSGGTINLNNNSNFNVNIGTGTSSGTIAIGNSSSDLALVDPQWSVTGAGTATFASIVGPLTGNASTATALQTARNINGVSFDGSGNITVTAAAGTLSGTTLNATVTGSSLTSVGTLTGLTLGGTLAMGANDITMTGSLGATGARLTKGWFADLEVTNTIIGSINGNAATATTAGTVTTAAQPSITSVGTLTGLTVSGNIDFTGANILGASPFVFEGTTANAIKTIFSITDPTVANKTIIFPNADGTVAVSATSPITLSALGDIGCATCMTSALLSGRIYVGNGSNVATGVAMSGDATISNTGVVTVTSGLHAYAMFYGLTAGTGNGGASDYAATVAVGAAVPFPKNGPTLGGIVALSSTTFKIPAIGTYEVNFDVHTTEPGQLQLSVDNGAGFVVADECTAANMNPTAGGHPIVGNCIITTTGVDAVLKVINPAGNATALTITPADGSSTHANVPTLIIKKL